MQKFTYLNRKTLLNYVSGWEFFLLLHKYPVVIYVNLHNINNNKLHEIKAYMSAIGGGAQVLNTHQLVYLFNNNIKFKFLTTGNIVTLLFREWKDVWGFMHLYKKWELAVLTLSVNGSFIQLYGHGNPYPLEMLAKMFEEHSSVMIKTTMQIGCSNDEIYNCLYHPVNITINTISSVLYQLAQTIENFSNNIKFIKN